MFAILSAPTFVLVFSIRSYREPLWKSRVFENKTLVGSVVFGFMALLLAIYWPPLQTILDTRSLYLMDWAWLGMLVAVELCLIEGYKGLSFKMLRSAV